MAANVCIAQRQLRRFNSYTAGRRSCNSSNTCAYGKNRRQYSSPVSIKRLSTLPFGIVAAITKNRVIGVNGRLPWNSIPEDTNHFVNLTRNKILITGRKSFEEGDDTSPSLKQIRMCIVVSRTMLESVHSDSGPIVMVARSFDEALEMASHEAAENDNSNGEIQCWIGGGERIYEEALQHQNATEVQLTCVDMTVDTTGNDAVACFPLHLLESCGYEEVSRVERGVCTFCVYRRQMVK